MSAISYIYIGIFFVFVCTSEVNSLQTECNSKSFDKMPCSPTETCKEINSTLSLGFCECLPGLIRNKNGSCEHQTETDTKEATIPKTSSLVDKDKDTNMGISHIAIAIVVPIFLITLVIRGIYLIRKYSLLMYIRNKFRQRRSNYNEVIIGQDMDDDDMIHP